MHKYLLIAALVLAGGCGCGGGRTVAFAGHECTTDADCHKSGHTCVNGKCHKPTSDAPASASALAPASS